jgi:molybdate transport system substrate-binding protein
MTFSGFGAAAPGHADEAFTIRVLAAGNLRAAIGEMAVAFTNHFGTNVESTFGSSGVLRERIEKGRTRLTFLPR